MSFFVLFPEADLVLSLNTNLLANPFDALVQETFDIAGLFLQDEPCKRGPQ